VPATWRELGDLYVQDFPEVFALLKYGNRVKEFEQAVRCFCQIQEAYNAKWENRVPSWKGDVEVTKSFTDKAGATDDLSSHLASVFQKYAALIRLEPEAFASSTNVSSRMQTYAPMEMVLVAVLVSQYQEHLSDTELLALVKHLRKRLREQYRVIRMNESTWRSGWSLLQDKALTLRRKRGSTDGVRRYSLRTSAKRTLASFLAE
jgi:hypothetical protein